MTKSSRSKHKGDGGEGSLQFSRRLSPSGERKRQEYGDHKREKVNVTD